MTFLDHLEELRWRILKSLIFIVLGSIMSFVYMEDILAILLRPVSLIPSKNPVQLQVLTVQGMFIIKWTIAVICGLIISIPALSYQAWKFISPALHINERGFALPLAVGSFISFSIGIAFGYFVLIPYSLNFFSSLTYSSVENNFSINYYFSFILWILLGSGLIFQLPVVSFLFSMIGVLTPAFMRHYRRHAIIMILVLSSFITPPDPVSMFIMALPLTFLYELSILISWIVNRK